MSRRMLDYNPLSCCDKGGSPKKPLCPALPRHNHIVLCDQHGLIHKVLHQKQIDSDSCIMKHGWDMPNGCPPLGASLRRRLPLLPGPECNLRVSKITVTRFNSLSILYFCFSYSLFIL